MLNQTFHWKWLEYNSDKCDIPIEDWVWEWNEMLKKIFSKNLSMFENITHEI